MSEKKSFHMSADEFRKNGHALIDWIANYHQTVEFMPVLSRVQPGEIRSKLPDSAPDKGESFEAVLKDVDDIIMPGITHWQSPNWFAFFRQTIPNRPFWESCSPPGSACRACCGRPVRHVPSSKRMCSIGWST